MKISVLLVLAFCLAAYDQGGATGNAVDAERARAATLQERLGIRFSGQPRAIVPRQPPVVTPRATPFHPGPPEEKRAACSVPLLPAGRPEAFRSPMPIIRVRPFAPMPNVKVPAPPCGSRP
jgi:hypothetical protein